MMHRKTITINDVIFKHIQKMRADFIGDNEIPIEDMSFTTAANMILLGGLVGANDFTEGTWSIIWEFLAYEKVALDKASFGDREYEEALRKLFARE